jgi:hypothetical protein
VKGPHGLQPADHEHVHCRFCDRDYVHVIHRRGKVVYAGHIMFGTDADCTRSHGQEVYPQDRGRFPA